MLENHGILYFYDTITDIFTDIYRKFHCIVSLNISFLNTSLTFDLSRKRRTVNVSR